MIPALAAALIFLAVLASCFRMAAACDDPQPEHLAWHEADDLAVAALLDNDTTN